MTLTHHLIAFISTAVVLLTVLVVGTLAAADLLRPARRPAGDRKSRTTPPRPHHT